MFTRLSAFVQIWLCAILALSNVAVAADFPDRPIRWIVPYPPGGASDVMARMFSMAGSMKLNGQPYVIENRPGASTIIGTQALATARPDGYTIGNIDSGFALIGLSRADVPFKLDDFSYIGGIGTQPMVLTVRPDFPAATLKDAVEFIKQSGDKLSYGTWGAGTANHFAAEDFLDRIRANHVAIPFAGSAPMSNALMAKQIDFAFMDMTTALPLASAGRIKVLAITSETRRASLPDVPAMAELFPDFEYVNFSGVAAPKGLPPEVLKLLSEALKSTVNQGDMKKSLEARDLTPWAAGPNDLRNLVNRQYERAKVIMAKRNIKFN